MKNRLAPLPMTVLTGFLGSGKTTLVNHLLRNAGGQRILVLVNDFGELPIDEDLILAQDGSTLTLANGCACCSMGGDLYQAFVTALAFDPAPDYLLIEASGVAEPRRIANFARAEPDLRLNAIVTVVDADHFVETSNDQRLQGILYEQVAAAQILLLNKTERAGLEKSRLAEDKIRQLNLSAALVKTNNCDVSFDMIFGSDPGEVSVGSLEDEKSSVSHEDVFERWSFKSQKPVGKENLRHVISALSSQVFRMKGLFRDQTEDGPVYVLHKVGDYIEISKYQGKVDPDFQSHFVAIGLKNSGLPDILQPVFQTLFAEGIPEKSSGLSA